MVRRKSGGRCLRAAGPARGRRRAPLARHTAKRKRRLPERRTRIRSPNHPDSFAHATAGELAPRRDTPVARARTCLLRLGRDHGEVQPQVQNNVSSRVFAGPGATSRARVRALSPSSLLSLSSLSLPLSLPSLSFPSRSLLLSSPFSLLPSLLHCMATDVPPLPPPPTSMRQEREGVGPEGLLAGAARVAEGTPQQRHQVEHRRRALQPALANPRAHQAWTSRIIVCLQQHSLDAADYTLL